MCVAILHPTNDTKYFFSKKLIGVTICNYSGDAVLVIYSVPKIKTINLAINI